MPAMNSPSPIDKAVAIVGSPAAVAALLGVTTQAVWLWRKGQARIRPAYAMALAEATEWVVTPHELRPDVYRNPLDGLPPDATQEAA